MAEDECCSMQLIDGDGVFNAHGLESFMRSVRLAECGLSYAVVAIMGPQSSGKSTLLNHLFHTNFKEMDSFTGRSQTTKGIWIAKCVGIEPCTIAMDLEGTDGRERGEDDTTFEKQSALFALAIADIVLINMWCHEIGREHGAYKPLLKTVFQVVMHLFSPRKTTLVFVIRDTTKTSLEHLEPVLREDIQKIWDSVTKLNDHKDAPLSEFFNVEVVALSHYELQEEQFKEQVAGLRQRVFRFIDSGGLAGYGRGVVPASGFSFHAQQIWKVIKENTDLDLPAHKGWLELERSIQSGPVLGFFRKQSSIIHTYLSERQVFETFKALRLKKDLLKGIGDYGYVKPCAVHLQTIVPLCGKTDVFAKVAEFEPGRISAICIGILQKLDCASPKCQAVVFAASKLSSQVIGTAMEQLGAYLKVKVYVCDGSEGDCPDDVHVVVGKAMYVMDEWSPSWEEHIKVVFFDKPSWQSSLEIAYIFKELLPSREKYHVCCFLERESKEVTTFKRVWMKEPVIIRVPHTLVLDKGKRRHRVISVTDDKSKLCEIINIYENAKKTSVVFADSPESVETLIEEMNKLKLVKVLPTTVGMNQKDRDKMTQKLLQAEARCRVLITTIEWANDIDLKQVERVVNYDLPHPVLEDYLHRMCRFGVEVDVINLVTGDQWFILFDIQQQYKNEVIFEAFYPDLRGPAGFPVPPVEGLEISEDKKLSPGIKHILYNVSTDGLKLSNIYEYLKEDLVKMKVVIFAKVDHSAVLKREGFNVHKMDDLKGFFQCKEDYCILLITEDKDALNYAHPKVPVVINFDLPLAPEIYNHRVAWCKTNGIIMHFVTGNDWLKVFHFQRPQSESIIGWPPSLVTDFSSMIRKARRGSSYSYDWESQFESESDASRQGGHWREFLGPSAEPSLE